MINQSFFKRITGFIGLSLFIAILSGCSALGTRTLYKTNDLNSYHLKKLGYSQPASEESLNKIMRFTSLIYQDSFENFFTDKPFVIEKQNLPGFEDVNTIDTTDIMKICSDNALDGYICTQIKYKFVDNYYHSIPFGKSEDVYVEMKLFDKHGNLILYIKHNTNAGNSYVMPPKAEQTVRDGTVGALKQIIKEIKKAKLSA